MIKVINIAPRTRPRSNTFVMAAPPQLPRTPVPPRYVGSSASSSSVASSSTLAVSTGKSMLWHSLRYYKQQRQFRLQRREGADEVKRCFRSPGPGINGPGRFLSRKLMPKASRAHDCRRTKQQAEPRRESDPVDQEVSQKRCKIRRKSNDGREI